ncbi:hypothetical protein FACS1894111_08210 [Clostridia bacterium]|nr:hypothetical protein FACS1894111_08210 [Clostridia bacterium]
MEKSLQQEFTRRISNANKSGMILIVYDIFLAYAVEIRGAYTNGEHDAFLTSVQKAQAVILELKDSLDFSYPIALELYRLYEFASVELAKCAYQNSTEGLDNAERVLKNLHQGFLTASKEDTSKPLMQHSQQVVAGMTYGKGVLNETLQDNEGGRGFLA